MCLFNKVVSILSYYTNINAIISSKYKILCPRVITCIENNYCNPNKILVFYVRFINKDFIVITLTNNISHYFKCKHYIIEKVVLITNQPLAHLQNKLIFFIYSDISC